VVVDVDHGTYDVEVSAVREEMDCDTDIGLSMVYKSQPQVCRIHLPSCSLILCLQ
jgi:phosphoribosyl-AMP cyclohydrolase